MFRFVTVAALAAALSGVATIARADNPPPAITVSGEATISVPPDLATIEAGVTTEAKTAKAASEANNKAMGDVLLALKGAGVPEKDYQTSRLSLSPQMTQNRTPNAPMQIAGYRASNRVIVKVRDISQVAGVIDTLVGAGANDVGGINFEVTQASKLLDEARTRALADARRKAEIYAAAANVKLGMPLSIAEGGGAVPVAYKGRLAAADAMSAPVAPGEETLRVSVSVTYEIKPATP